MLIKKGLSILSVQSRKISLVLQNDCVRNSLKRDKMSFTSSNSFQNHIINKDDNGGEDPNGSVLNDGNKFSPLLPLLLKKTFDLDSKSVVISINPDFIY